MMRMRRMRSEKGMQRVYASEGLFGTYVLGIDLLATKG